jgi:hypothetical protein
MIATLLIVLGVILILSGIVLLPFAKHAPYGEEDETGFHFDPTRGSNGGTPPVRPSSSRSKSRSLEPKVQFPAA